MITLLKKCQETLKSKILQHFLGVFRFKNLTEFKMINNGFKKSLAKLKRSFYRNCEVFTYGILNRPVWEIKPKSCNSDLLILFLHGGAYIANMTKMRWNLAEKLLIKTCAIVIVPDYPLAPENAWKDTYAFLDELYLSLLRRYSKKIVFIGDSAGGELALGFAQKLKNEKRRLPDHIVLFSSSVLYIVILKNYVQ